MTACGATRPTAGRRRDAVGGSLLVSRAPGARACITMSALISGAHAHDDVDESSPRRTAPEAEPRAHYRHRLSDLGSLDLLEPYHGLGAGADHRPDAGGEPRGGPLFRELHASGFPELPPGGRSPVDRVHSDVPGILRTRRPRWRLAGLQCHCEFPPAHR